MIIAALLVGFVVSLWLLIVGIRGRRIDDHPLCRRCGFDLTGRPADSVRCGECGASLQVPRAVRVGHRVVRRAWVVVASVLLMIDLGSAGLVGWAATRDVNWLQYYPTAFLIRRAADVDAPTRQASLDELMARERIGKLSLSQWNRLIDAAVAYRSDTTKPWEAHWATLLDDARRGHYFDDDRWDHYLLGLLPQCKSTDTSRRDPALNELLAALINGRPTTQQWARATTAALDVQGDPHSAWTSAWGDLIETAFDKKHLSDADWRRYAAQAWPGMFGLRVRTTVRRGDPLPFWVDCYAGRVAKKSKLGCRIRDMKLRFDGQPLPKPNGSHSSMSSLMEGGSAMGGSLSADEFPPGVPDGTRSVQVSGDVEIGLHDAIFDEKGDALASGRFDLAGTTTLQPADRPTVAIIHNPALADAIRKSIKVDAVRNQVGDRPYVGFTVSIDGPPVGIGFDIFFSQEGRETHMCSLSCPAWTRNHTYGLGGSMSARGKTIDVIFRSTPAAAASTTDTFEVWDGEISFHDVAVQK